MVVLHQPVRFKIRIDVYTKIQSKSIVLNSGRIVLVFGSFTNVGILTFTVYLPLACC